ncbi:MAG: SLBB domain-containing protein [Gammaproteobacteria bacterium]|nr:SLBB domain-containing protein [Gammaproteobacteria bacterium]
MNKIKAIIAASVIPLLLIAVPAGAQSTGLTPQQELMINSLPPAQRQQALEALQQNKSGPALRVGERVQETVDTPSSALSPAIASFPVVETLRVSANSRLVVNFTPKESLSNNELQELQADRTLSRLSGSRTYVLDDNGVLSLLGIQSIPLLGLTEPDIERRLGAESLLSAFDIDARILETQPTGVEALKPFGYDIFEPKEASFDPPMTGPVPPDYILGPGDTVRVQLFGNVNGIYEIDVTRDGILNIPEIGPVTVANLSFSEFREDVNRRVREMLIGTQVSVTMGQLRTIRIFVLGDVNRPGSYVVDSLATISSALYRSGGISRIGSLRDIQLKRRGNVAARLDLYDLLLKGDTSGDNRLQPGDVIFVTPIGSQVSVTGAVKRPAIYEIRGRADIDDVITMAGGLLPDAYPDGARIERIEAGQERIVISVDADSPAAAAMAVNAGDLLMIPSILPEFERVVTLSGHVHRPGPYQWQPGMRLTDLVESALALKPGGDLNYLLIRREDPRNRKVSVVSANLAAALVDPNSEANTALQARDTVQVFNAAFGRQRVIQPILEELQLQSQHGEPYTEVSITGQVKASGSYPLESGMRVSDLIRAGGNLAEQAYTLKAEIARYAISGGQFRNTEVIDIDLDAILSGNMSADLVLQEHDNLRISKVPEWDSLWAVQLEGEVTFPGRYRIRGGETLRQILDRAGGLTDDAFPEGAVFLREALRQREQEQLEVLARRMQADLNSLSLENRNESNEESMRIGQSLLAQLEETEAVGRLVVDLEQVSVAAPDTDIVGDVELRDGDQILVPKRAQEVTVIGETQQNTSHLFQQGLSRDDYIQMSGGLTRRADKQLIYVVRASGAVIAGNRSKWFGRRNNAEIRPGDTIVVPLETNRIRPLTLWTGVTQILYQAAIALAAVDSFND